MAPIILGRLLSSRLVVSVTGGKKSLSAEPLGTKAMAPKCHKSGRTWSRSTLEPWLWCFVLGGFFTAFAPCRDVPRPALMGLAGCSVRDRSSACQLQAPQSCTVLSEGPDICAADEGKSSPGFMLEKSLDLAFCLAGRGSNPEPLGGGYAVVRPPAAADASGMDVPLPGGLRSFATTGKG